MYRLMVKTCKSTGLKYLCQTSKEDYLDYRGSGKFWKRHIRKHKSELETVLLGEYETHEELKEFGRIFSEKFDVVNSPEWANLRVEEGDGGDTVSMKKWITNGPEEKYVEKTTEVPDGWRAGRSDRCAFNNIDNQRAFSSRVDRKKNGESIKRAWAEGRINRDHSKCGVRGQENPAKRPEVRQKISQSRMGQKVSPETRKKMSESKMGRVSPNRGKKLSEEVRRKMREGQRRRFQKQNIHDETIGDSNKKE